MSLRTFRVGVLGLIFNLICPALMCQDLVNKPEKPDSLAVEVGGGFIVSGQENFLPFYLVNNQFGEVQEDQSFFLRGEINYNYQLSKKLTAITGFSFRNDLFSSYFVKVNLGKLFLSAGREREIIGGIQNGLSSGSLGISQNARPIPMVSLGLSDYINLPFTKGYLKFKGNISHGWFEENRVIANAQFHSKSFYAQLDLDKQLGLKISSGLVHFAQFGGIENGTNELPDSFSDYIRVFKGAGATDGPGTAGENNALGNHLGIVETTVEKSLGDQKLTLNYQVPFEDRGGLQYINFRDFMINVEWDLGSESGLLKKIYFEVLQSRWQGGPGLPDTTALVQTIEDNQGFPFGQRDDTYNNFLYRSGWTHHGQVIGNPLFLTYQRTLNFFDVYPDYGVAIANNRIWSFHTGMMGVISPGLDYELLFTYSRNSGTYAGLYEGRFNWEGILTNPNFEYVFLPVQNQYYSSLNLKYQLPQYSGFVQLRLGYDFGDLYQLFATEVSFNFVLNR